MVLTGATKGIGRALALELGRGGHRLAVCGRDRAALDAVAAEVRLQLVDATVLDVRDAARVNEWADKLMSDGFVPDLLVNNAGAINRPAAFWELSADEFDRVVSVNVLGVANVARAFLPGMLRARRGVLVNMSSGWGRFVSPRVSAYCASKFAVEGLTKAIASELPAPLAAVAVSPGVIRTAMTEICFERPQYEQLQRPDDWARRAAPFLLQLSREHNGESAAVPG